MQMKSKLLNVKAGKPIAILNNKQAEKHSIFVGDRIKISNGDKNTVAVVDLSNDVDQDTIMLFNEASQELSVDNNDTVEIQSTVKPDSLQYIRNKIECKDLSKEQIYSIVEDAVNNRLTGPELMAYTIGLKMTDFSIDEAQYLSEAMVKTGETIDFERAFDKHCIGGVAGNRTTPLIVSMIGAAGYKIPKTSSRAITSPAGTADVVEVFCDIEFTPKKIKEIVNDINCCMTWGGGVNLAPADDEFINVRKSLELDPLEQVLSSVLAKKKSVGSKYVLIDIPVGDEAKVKDKEEANKFAKYFKELGNRLDMNVHTIISDGSNPIGNGIGPKLEAIDLIKILKSGGEEGPEDLKEKSIRMANILLEQAGSEADAKEILESGKAYEKFREMVEKQNGDVDKLDNIELDSKEKVVYAEENGKVKSISNKTVTRVSRIAGCPEEKDSGIFLNKDINESVEEGDELFKIYSKSDRKLEKALKVSKEQGIYSIEPFV